ncbi:MAG: glycosyltransferase family 4 protein [Cyanobacteria bacterium P01_D01_bin.14]
MHIITFSSHPSSNRGGQELSLLEVCRNLHQKGHCITLLHSHEGDLLSQYRLFCKSVVPVNAYKILRKKHLFSFLRDLIRVALVKGDLVYSNQYYDCFLGAALVYLKRIPLFCHLRTPAPEALASTDLQLKLGLQAVTRFIAVSQETRRGWVKLGFSEKKIAVVYNGTDIERFKPANNIHSLRQAWGIQEKTQVISYVGRLDVVKGLESLIRAVALMIEKKADVTLVIAGQPAYQKVTYVDELKQLVQKLSIANQVKFLGHLSDTVPIYQLSDVTVLPSIYSEPFARSTIESMACGTPVVMSDIGGTVELLREKFPEWLFEPGNPHSLAKTIQPILDWRTTQPGLGNLCCHHISVEFSIQNTIDQIESIMMSEISV